MRFEKIFLAAAVVALSTAAGAAPARAQSAASFFPLEVGNVWEYDVVGPDAPVRVEVDASRRSSATTLEWFRLRNFQGDAHWVRTSRSGRAFERTGGLWYRFDAPVQGPTWPSRGWWSFDLDDGAGHGSAFSTSRGAKLGISERHVTVRVPAGVFRDCIHITWFDVRKDAFSSGPGPFVSDEWFAPGVGLVKREVSDYDRPWDAAPTWVLRSATIGGRRIDAKPRVALRRASAPPAFGVRPRGDEVSLELERFGAGTAGTLGLEVDGLRFGVSVPATTGWNAIPAADAAFAALAREIESAGFVVETFGRLVYSQAAVRWKIWRK